MNPICDWVELRDKEIMAGGSPKVCIMGEYDYSRFCGAVLSVFGLESFGTTENTEFEGVKLFMSRSNKEGIMFG